MEHWSARDDRPYIRPAEPSHGWLPALVIVLIVAVGAAALWWQLGGPQGWSLSDEAPPAPQAGAAPPPAPAPPPQPLPAEPIVEPAPPPPSAKPLPALDKSDPMARESLTELMGRQAFSQLVLPEHLVRRIVATVDNLPRPTAARRTMPFKAVPGRFAVAASGEAFTLEEANFSRYAPYVRVLASLEAETLARTYARAYPLFQKAYRELGYPDGNFHRRLVEAIDDMLAAPEVDAPVKLMRPKVLYEFADPDLETRSAGQKMLVRMGGKNAALVKKKLREIRAALIAAGRPQ
jgi:hypothetical protein